MRLIDKILSKLRDENKLPKLKIQPQEGDWVAISFFINYDQRIQLIDSIENNAEIPAEFLCVLAESIRSGKLNRESWREEEKAYYDRMYRLISKP